MDGLISIILHETDKDWNELAVMYCKILYCGE